MFGYTKQLLVQLFARRTCIYVNKELCMYIYAYAYTAGKISIKYVTNFISKYISKKDFDINCHGKNPSNPEMQRN